MLAYQKMFLSVVYRLLVLLVLYQICRLSFFVINYNYFSHNSVVELLSIFFYGTRFDFYSIAILNSAFWILYLLPYSFTNKKYYTNTLNVLFWTVNGIALLFNFIDCTYFPFINKRTTFDLFIFMFESSDVRTLLPRFVTDYWFIPLLWIATLAFGWLLIKVSPIKTTRDFRPRWWVSLLLIPELLLLIGLTFVGVRGTGLKPVNMVTASRFTSTVNFPLILNTPFSIMRTLKDDGIKQVHYFDDGEAQSIFDPVHVPTTNDTMTKDNVVVIILESFSSFYVGSHRGERSLTPFLDSLMTSSLVFENGFANGKRSIQALPSIFASIPPLMEEPYVSSQYGSDNIGGLPTILARHGYHTSFFHGGHNGTMRFDDFCRAAGISEYYGFNEYVGPPADNGEWGINDEEFLNFFAHKLDSFPKPFMSGIFTLSSHHPFDVPARYKDTFKEGKLPIYKMIEYTDYSLRRFFQTISKKVWFEHTLFVFTADHTAPDENQGSESTSEVYHVPIFFYHPGDTNLRGHRSTIAQQADIMSTVLDYLHANDKYVSFGNSLLDTSKNTFAVEYTSGVYNIINSGYNLQSDGEKILSFSPIGTSRAANEDLVKTQIERKLRSIIQQFNSRLIENRLTVK